MPPMHWDCYALWNGRPGFARAYFQMWVEAEKTNPHWSNVYLDDALLITVNPGPPVETVHLHLAETGSKHVVALADWASWIASGARSVAAEHHVVRAAFEPLLPILRVRFPTADDLLGAIDRDAKASSAAAAREREHRRRVGQVQERALASQNLAANTTAISDLHGQLMRGERTCPHCDRRGVDFGLNDGGTRRKSFVVCSGCGRSFG